MSSSKKDLESRSSNFATTCNLLTQYLKEKGKLKELSRSISGNLESIGKSNASQISKPALLTKNLLTNNLADLNQPPIEEATIIPMEELPSLGQVVSQNNREECSNKANTSNHATTMESKSGQMTILYDGKIWVFDDLPANKAFELMILASKGNTTSAPTNGHLFTSGKKQNNIVLIPDSNSRSRVKKDLSISGKGKLIEEQPDNDDNNSDDMPIARRSSLYRFFEKRKERSSVRGLYQLGGDSPGHSSEDDREPELRL